MTEFGVPGENWDASRQKWHGQPVLMVRNSYADWSGQVAAREQSLEVLAGYGDQIAGTSEELSAARRLIVECFERSIAELKDNVFDDLERMMEISDEDWDDLEISMLGCSESPFGGSMYRGKPELGSVCLFCGGRYR